MSIESMKRIKSLLQDTKMIDSHTISAVVAECDMAILAKQPATPEPVAQWQKRHPVRTGGRWISTDEHDAKWWSERATGWEARALYTRPAPSGLGDVVRNAERYEWLRKADGWPCVFPDYFDPEPLAGSELDECVDAAMLATKDSK